MTNTILLITCEEHLKTVKCANPAHQRSFVPRVRPIHQLVFQVCNATTQALVQLVDLALEDTLVMVTFVNLVRCVQIVLAILEFPARIPPMEHAADLAHMDTTAMVNSAVNGPAASTAHVIRVSQSDTIRISQSIRLYISW